MPYIFIYLLSNYVSIIFVISSVYRCFLIFLVYFFLNRNYLLFYYVDTLFIYTFNKGKVKLRLDRFVPISHPFFDDRSDQSKPNQF